MPLLAEFIPAAVPAHIASAARAALAQIPGSESYAVRVLRRRLLQLDEDLSGLRFELDQASYRVPYDEHAFAAVLEERARVLESKALAETAIEVLLAV